ncbi:hypothetical protein JX265_005779 [Neoarthrinium moseri]|uniref:Uncharacterized protein n=1 Tax=Neoarthrinium moseri TaxID=1658444 RepID=A0A9P9WNQ4_9PEZI|nr:hypothetical protein JX265_005779 [Neoarthrinium moseri]
MQLFTLHRFNYLLAGVLLAPSALQLCLAAPQPLGNDPQGVTLGLRKDSNPLKTFKANVDNAPVKASQDRTAFADFSNAGQQTGSSRGFNQCVGVIISTHDAALFGHYTCGDQGQQRARQDLQQYWNQHKDDKLKNPDVMIYAKVVVNDATGEVMENSFESASTQVFINLARQITGKTPAIEKYFDLDAYVTMPKPGESGRGERPGFDQDTALAYSDYAGFWVSKNGPRFMTVRMQKEAAQK